MCAIYRDRLANGDDEREIVGDLALEFGIQRAAVRKSLRSGGALPPYQPQDDNGQRRGARKFEKRAGQAERIAVLRPATADACRRCGVRADVGCKHQPPSGPPPIALIEVSPEPVSRSAGQGWSLHKDRFAGGLALGLAQLATDRRLNERDEQS